jgi:hypothetical protein
VLAHVHEADGRARQRVREPGRAAHIMRSEHNACSLMYMKPTAVPGSASANLAAHRTHPVH